MCVCVCVYDDPSSKVYRGGGNEKSPLCTSNITKDTVHRYDNKVVLAREKERERKREREKLGVLLRGMRRSHTHTHTHLRILLYTY
jgi:hypothetical protein